MKFLRSAVIAALVAMFVFAGIGPIVIAHADGTAPPPTPPGTLDPGVDRYYAILDIAGIPQPAQCGTGAGSGAFGYLGKDASMAGGANGYQTGLNNSAVCGNR